jgi:DNA-binding LytR/AlgR family response regulator
MQKLKIGIVEDELLIARSIKEVLEQLDYDFTETAISYTEALQMIAQENPDVLLLDITLSGKKDGIDVAEYVNQKHQMPFIFLTANSDLATINRAKAVKPHAYLVKPFVKEELFAAIEIAFSNYSGNRNGHTHLQQSTKINDSLFIKDNHTFIKLHFTEIAYIESDENYVKVHTTNGKHIMIRSTFSDFLKQLPPEMFFKTSRSFAVQLALIEKVEPSEVLIGAAKIPLSKAQREPLYQTLGLK